MPHPLMWHIYFCKHCMQVDYLIVGQGICGTMLSWFLYKEGKSFLVIDEGSGDTSSKIAAGIINPVTGRRFVRSWMIDEIMPFAVDTYEKIGLVLDNSFVYKRSVIDFFSTPEARNSFINRLVEDDTFLHTYPDQNHFNQFFHYDFGCGEISPAYTVHLQVLLSAWRKKLMDNHSFREDKFEPKDLQVKSDKVEYQNISAQKIIFCDGVASMESPWFNLLPFSANKGEALIIESEELTNGHIFKRGMMLAPLPEKHTYWVGSNYIWEYADAKPTQQFYDKTTTLLNTWLKVPFKVLDHKAAVRPATIERRPFIGFHPQYPTIGILNGMGTKGTSLAPFFAHQMAQHLVYDIPLMEEVDVRRFSRILSK